MSSVISGTQHFIIPKRIVWTTLLVGIGAFLGMYLSEHIRARHTEEFLRNKNEGVKTANTKLQQEKTEYQEIFERLTDHLDEWKKSRDMTHEQQTQHVATFHGQAQALMEGLADMQTLLEEKEFQLWEKEGLLEYQEERLMNSEDLELEMANYINEMATILQSKNLSLPNGLQDKPYYGSQYGGADDDTEEGGNLDRRRLTHIPSKHARIQHAIREAEASQHPQKTGRRPPAAHEQGSGNLRAHFLHLKEKGNF